jgi:hypothetical protein
MAIKNTQHFAEVEFCMQHYFDGNIATIMKSVRDDLSKKQTHELAEYLKSPAGVMSGPASAMAGSLFNPVDTVKSTGKWSSKTAEDYLEMCKQKIVANKDVQADLQNLAAEWRTAVVKEVGRDKYDKLSKSMGCDLAYAYVDYRTEQMMLNYMVKQEMPKSTAEYVMRKGISGTILNLDKEMQKSALQTEIDHRCEVAYKPSLGERVAGRAISIGADAISTGGMSSWSSLADYVGIEAAFEGIDYMSDKRSDTKSKSIEKCISEGVFNSHKNVFDSIRTKQHAILAYDNSYVLSVNNKLKNKMSILTEKPKSYLESDKPFDLPSPTKMMAEAAAKPDTSKRPSNIPLVVAPGHEQEYLDAQKKGVKEEKVETVEENEQSVEEQTQSNEVQPTNTDGWNTLLSSMGLNDMGKVGANLGYVIAMLPDMLLGMFTGKTQSVNLKKDMIPIASILLGMVVKNPLLKMSLVGLGGANLLNKVGHEAIDREAEKEGLTSTQQFKQYPDEQLNARITNPTINGNTLVAYIDRVPCSVTLPDNAVAAYQAGALPLNTLANAVLAKSDKMQQIQTNYQNVDLNRANDRQITLK